MQVFRFPGQNFPPGLISGFWWQSLGLKLSWTNHVWVGDMQKETKGSMISDVLKEEKGPLLILLQVSTFFFFFFFPFKIYLAVPVLVVTYGTFSCSLWAFKAWGIWFPDQGLNPGLLHWEWEVLTTGPPGKSWSCLLDTHPCPYQGPQISTPSILRLQ